MTDYSQLGSYLWSRCRSWSSEPMGVASQFTIAPVNVSKCVGLESWLRQRLVIEGFSEPTLFDGLHPCASYPEAVRAMERGERRELLLSARLDGKPISLFVEQWEDGRHYLRLVIFADDFGLTGTEGEPSLAEQCPPQFSNLVQLTCELGEMLDAEGAVFGEEPEGSPFDLLPGGAGDRHEHHVIWPAPACS